MRSSFILLTLSALLLPLSASAQAQQPTKIPRIGIVTLQPLAGIASRQQAFLQGLRELGYVEGKNIVIEYRSAEGKLGRLPALMAEIVRLNVDVVLSHGPTTTRAAKQATSTIPIVMAQDPDPIGNGFVTSLARSGGNITGLSSLSTDLSGKRLELLKETLPKLTRVALFGTSTNQGNAQSQKETELAAAALGLKPQYIDILGPKDIESAFQVASLAVKHRLPSGFPAKEYVDAGGLLSYGPDLMHISRRGAVYVDKILKGTKPADLPVEQPKKFEFVVNLKAAKQIGLTIPPNVLVRADRVIR